MRTANWGILLICALVFAAGATLFGLAAIVLSGHAGWALACIAMSLGLYITSGCTLRLMERF